MKTVIVFLAGWIFFTGDIGIAQFSKIEYDGYMVRHNSFLLPIHANYLYLGTVALASQFVFTIRQSSTKYPGDYFYPADSYIYPQFVAKDLHVQLTGEEIKKVRDFLKENFLSNFSDSIILASIKCYNFNFPNGLHREPYTMFSSEDTVYVISGWLGKFLSFYRVVPGDKRLTVPELMKQLDGITPLSREIKEGAFRHESDSLNYLLEYVDKEKMIRVRNYLMKTVLPPNSPDSPEKFYNLIEITKFLDKDAMP